MQRDNRPISADMFSHINGDFQTTCSVELCFILNDKDIKSVKRTHIVDRKINGHYKKTMGIIKKYTLDESDGSVKVRTTVMAHSFSDEPLNHIGELSADDLKKLCGKYQIEYTKKDESIERMNDFITENYETLEKEVKELEVDWKSIVDILPRFEYYSKTTVGTPLNLVNNTLSLVYRQFFYEKDEDGNERLREELGIKKKGIEKELDRQIEDQLLEKIKANNGRVRHIKGDYWIEFSEGFRLADLHIDLGSGPNSINNVGEGTKTRLFLAITEWDREVRAKEQSRKVIRGYDEPDTNLHYGAQKEMYFTLKNLSSDSEANVQVLICIHSLMMIDRASPFSIIHIKHENGISTPEWLKNTDDEEIIDYLDNMSDLSGIRNSSLFFERCFLIVEGYTEEKVLPIIYETATGKSFSSEGIVLKNLKTNSAWDKFLELLGKNKSDATILFLDRDIQGTKKRIDIKRIQKIEFSENFIKNNVILAGDKELEDVFPDDVICSCLNEKWPKRDGGPWQMNEISALRQRDKFSDALVSEVYDLSGRITKHDFGEQVAKMLTKEQIESIPCFSKFINLAKTIIR